MPSCRPANRSTRNVLIRIVIFQNKCAKGEKSGVLVTLSKAMADGVEKE